MSFPLALVFFCILIGICMIAAAWESKHLWLRVIIAYTSLGIALLLIHEVLSQDG